MKRNDKIFVAGHNGLVGTAVLENLKSKGFKNIITINRQKLDLRNYNKVEKFFNNKKIDYMIMAAAKAGGILANSSFQKDFFIENIEIQNSLLQFALKKKIKRTIYLGTSCVYPKYAKNPIKEESLLTGSLEKTNQCYAIAKIAGIKLSEALYENQNLDIICLMPTNVYGLNDNFDKSHGHVIPAMISKFVDAKAKKAKKIYLLGTGKPIREFIHTKDLAEAIITCLNILRKKLRKNFKNKLPIFNIGTGESLNISKLANLITKLINFEGKIIFDNRFPDGTFKKNLNSNKINKFGWKPQIKLKDGLKEVIQSRLI